MPPFSLAHVCPNVDARFNSTLSDRSSRSALFGAYDDQSRSRSPNSNSNGNSGYGYGLPSSGSPAGGAFSAYPGANGNLAAGQSQFRAATPNKRGQYSAATMDELESQNDEQLEGMSARVKMLKDVSALRHHLVEVIENSDNGRGLQELE